jgi:hypothetical protein
MARVFEIFYVFTAANRMSAALNVIRRDLDATGKSADTAAAQITRLRANLILGGAALLGFAAGVRTLTSLYNAGQQVANSMARLQLQGLKAADQARIYQAAWSTAMTVHGTLISSNIDLAQDLYSALGNVGEAIQALPEMAKIQKGLSILTGQGILKEGTDKAFLSLAKAADILVGPGARFAPMLDTMFRIMEASKGFITPESLLSFTQRAGTAGRMLTPEGLIKISEAIAEMGGGTVGSALQQWDRMILGPTMTFKQAQMWQRFGLIRPGGIIGKTVMPEPLVESDLALTDPAAWVQRVLIPHIAKTVGKTPAEVMAQPGELNKVIGMLLAGRIRSIMTLVGMIATQPARIERQVELFQKAAGYTQVDAIYDNTNQMQLLRKSLDNLGQELGLSTKQLVDRFVPGIRSFIDNLTKFFQVHPTIRAAVPPALMGLTAFLGIQGFLRIFEVIAQFMRWGATANIAQWLAGVINPFRWLGVILQQYQIGMGLSLLVDKMKDFGILLSRGAIIEALGPTGLLILGLTAAAALVYAIYKTTREHPFTIPTDHPLTADPRYKGLKPYIDYDPMTGTIFHPRPKVTPGRVPLTPAGVPHGANITLSPGSIVIHAAAGQNEEKLANIVIDKLVNKLQTAMMGTTLHGGVLESGYLHGAA